MSKAQYKRFAGIFFIPLLILGIWLAESESLINQHHQTFCEDFATHFRCISIEMSQKEKSTYRSTSGGVYVHGAQLTHGFHENIISNGIREMEYKNGALQEKQIIGAGVKKTINIDKNAGANYSGNGPCTLSLHANSEVRWILHCLNGITEDFTFPSNQINEKYLKLAKSNKAENQRLARSERIGFFISLLLPLILFLLASAIVYAAIKIKNFVIYGRKQPKNTIC